MRVGRVEQTYEELESLGHILFVLTLKFDP